MGPIPQKSTVHMQEKLLTEEQRKALPQNVDALYIYLDAFMDEMTEEEKKMWLTVLKELDPDFEKNETEEDD